MAEHYSKINELNLSQPDASTCQSACIGMVVRDPNIRSIRNKLLEGGTAGDPYNMQRIIKQYTSKVSFEEDASLAEVKEWLKAGESLITHGWFTRSGHVICLDGVSIDEATLSYKLNVKDPWSEFFARSWGYPQSNQITFYDGYYSSYCIYAACVASSSVNHAKHIYNRGELDSRRSGMWVHRIYY